MPEPRPTYTILATAILTAALLLSAYLLARAIHNPRAVENTISVDGSARRVVRSDFLVWDGTVTEQAPTIGAAFSALQTDIGKFSSSLNAHGVLPAEIFPSTVTTTVLYASQSGKAAQDGDQSTTYRKVAGYQVSESLEVRSSRVDLMGAISLACSDLMRGGISVDSQPTQYLITNLNDLKGTILAEAAQNARSRADQIARGSGATLGPLLESHMGEMLVTPAYSDANSDASTDDVSSLDKKVTVLVTSVYTVR